MTCGNAGLLGEDMFVMMVVNYRLMPLKIGWLHGVISAKNKRRLVVPYALCSAVIRKMTLSKLMSRKVDKKKPKLKKFKSKDSIDTKKI